MAQETVDPKLHTFHAPKIKGVVRDAVNFLMATPVRSLPPSGSFPGTGVYAIYYTGSLPLYTKLAELNKNKTIQPIYVGKAVPYGWRTARTPSSTSTQPLYRRLCEHAHGIRDAINLEISEFCCRFAILGGIETDLIGAVEAELIRLHRPIWNTLLEGFGNHDPGRGRYNQARSEWDVLHPGRPWAERLTGLSPDLASIHEKLQSGI